MDLETWLITAKNYVFLGIGVFFLFFILSRYFRSKWYKHKNFPIYSGLRFLFLGYLVAASFWNTILQGFCNLFNLWSQKEIFSPPSDNFSILLFLIFAIAVCIALFVFYNKRFEVFLQNEKENAIIEKQRKKTLPPEIPTFSPIFHERIKKLFEIKYKGLILEYDTQNRSLYGSYKDGLRYFTLIIYCHETKAPENIQSEQIDIIYNQLNEDILSNLDLNSKAITEFYYIVETGKISNNNPNIHCYSEDSFLDGLINFDPYLDELIAKYKYDPLPFNSPGNTSTLAGTFIIPKYNDGEINLEEKLDNWLTEEGNKHFAILGDYGMGKTSFLKYYAAKLATNIIDDGVIRRFPVFISLTNTSPMHEGIITKCKSFVADKIGVDYPLFEYLIHRGKLLFILDGFDEMGFIGSHDQRFMQLDSIWQLATRNNKIIISGRPSYFPNEFDLKEGLNIKSKQEEGVPQVFPYCEQIVLDKFTWEQIEEVVKKAYPNATEYRDLIQENKSLYELCERPSMFHIVKEMLPDIYKNYSKDSINAGTLMNNYIKHWIDRQFQKGILSVYPNLRVKKRMLIINFFRDLAGKYYKFGQGNLLLTSEQIFKELEPVINRLDFEKDEEKQGFQHEIITSYFVERELTSDKFKFVHKSFYEYFVSLKIIDLIKENKFEDNLILEKEWTEEITDFVYESKEVITKDFNSSEPLLISLTKSSRKQRIANFITRETNNYKLILGLLLGFIILVFLQFKLFNYYDPVSLKFNILAKSILGELNFEKLILFTKETRNYLGDLIGYNLNLKGVFMLLCFIFSFLYFVSDSNFQKKYEKILNFFSPFIFAYLIFFVSLVIFIEVSPNEVNNFQLYLPIYFTLFILLFHFPFLISRIFELIIKSNWVDIYVFTFFVIFYSSLLYYYTNNIIAPFCCIGIITAFICSSLICYIIDELLSFKYRFFFFVFLIFHLGILVSELSTKQGNILNESTHYHGDKWGLILIIILLYINIFFLITRIGNNLYFYYNFRGRIKYAEKAYYLGMQKQGFQVGNNAIFKVLNDEDGKKFKILKNCKVYIMDERLIEKNIENAGIRIDKKLELIKCKILNLNIEMNRWGFDSSDFILFKRSISLLDGCNIKYKFIKSPNFFKIGLKSKLKNNSLSIFDSKVDNLTITGHISFLLIRNSEINGLNLTKAKFFKENPIQIYIDRSTQIGEELKKELVNSGIQFELMEDLEEENEESPC